MNALNNSSCEDKQAFPKICNVLRDIDSVIEGNASRNELISKRGQALQFAPRKTMCVVPRESK